MTKVCAHTFVDPNICSKCGWLPPQASQPPPSEFSDEWIDEQIEALPDFQGRSHGMTWERAVFRAGVQAGLEEAAKSVRRVAGMPSAFEDAIESRAAELRGMGR